MVLLAIFGLALTLILLAKKVTAAVFWGLIGTAVVGVIAGLCGVANMPQLPTAIMQFNFEMPTLGAFMTGSANCLRIRISSSLFSPSCSSISLIQRERWLQWQTGQAW